MLPSGGKEQRVGGWRDRQDWIVEGLSRRKYHQGREREEGQSRGAKEGNAQNLTKERRQPVLAKLKLQVSCLASIIFLTNSRSGENERLFDGLEPAGVSRRERRRGEDVGDQDREKGGRQPIGRKREEGGRREEEEGKERKEKEEWRRVEEERRETEGTEGG
jgi:hypothetical protein